MNTVLENTLLQDNSAISLRPLYSCEFSHNKTIVNGHVILHLQNIYLRQLLTNQIIHPARKASINVVPIDTGSVTEGCWEQDHGVHHEHEETALW